MAENAIVLAPREGCSHAEFLQLAREAEDTGLSGVFIPESTNDGLVCACAAADVTKRIRIGTWIVNIYLRQPTSVAAAAEAIQDISGGRFTLGLGVSHRPLLGPRGIDMENGRDHLRDATNIIRDTWAGKISLGSMKFRIPTKTIPIYLGALTLETARLAGEVADGVMLYMCTPDRLKKSIKATHEAAAKIHRKPADVAVTLGVPTFVHDNLATAYANAKRRLAFSGALPFYNRIFARSGFEAEAKAMAEATQRNDPAAAAAAISEKFVDAISLCGPPSRCRERLAEYRKQADFLPIIAPNPVDEDYPTSIRRNIKAFA